jgi:hypothetical protein
MGSLTRTLQRKTGGSKRPKPSFSSRQDFNAYYATHCWACRTPLAPHVASACLERWEENPDTGFMMYCDRCK